MGGAVCLPWASKTAACCTAQSSSGIQRSAVTYESLVVTEGWRISPPQAQLIQFDEKGDREEAKGRKKERDREIDDHQHSATVLHLSMHLRKAADMGTVPTVVGWFVRTSLIFSLRARKSKVL